MANEDAGLGQGRIVSASGDGHIWIWKPPWRARDRDKTGTSSPTQIPCGWDQSEVDGCSLIAKLSIALTSGVPAVSLVFESTHLFYAPTRHIVCNRRVQRAVGVDAPVMVASI